MGKYKPLRGVINNARSPGSIQNAEHHDQSGTQKEISGIPGTIDRVVADSEVEEVLSSGAIIRVINLSGAAAFLWTGLAAASPGTVDASNGFGLADGESQMVFMGELEESGKSVAVKASDSGVQIVVIDTGSSC